jgi:hypothetical protein
MNLRMRRVWRARLDSLTRENGWEVPNSEHEVEVAVERSVLKMLKDNETSCWFDNIDRDGEDLATLRMKLERLK